MSPAPRGRDPFYDNLKFLLVTLVVIGHGWAPLTGSHPVVQALYLTVYSFHMPAFILISGYFSRNFDATPARVQRLVTGVVIPYLVFETTYEVVFDVVHGRPLAVTLLRPSHAMWFLVALFFWRTTAGVWQALRWPIPTAFAISLLAGTTHLTQTMSIARTLQFLPWFVIGMFLRPEHFVLARRAPVRWGALGGALLCVAGVCVSAQYGLTSAVFLNTRGHQQLDMGLLEWLPLRLGTYAVAAVMTLAILAWTPRRLTWFTALGAGTLYTYLLHVGVVRALRSTDFFALDAVNTGVGLTLWTLSLVVLSVLLASAPSRRAFAWAVEPGLDRLFAPQRSPSASPTQPQAPPDRRRTARRTPRTPTELTVDLRDPAPAQPPPLPPEEEHRAPDEKPPPEAGPAVSG